MAFDRTNFAKGDNNFNSDYRQAWLYSTTDAKAAVDSAGYFNDVADFVKVGDVIRAKTSTGGSTEYLEYYVSANDGTTVDVNDGVQEGGSTDTD